MEYSKPIAADAVDYTVEVAKKAKEVLEEVKPKIVDAAKYTKEKYEDLKETVGA